MYIMYQHLGIYIYLVYMFTQIKSSAECVLTFMKMKGESIH